MPRSDRIAGDSGHYAFDILADDDHFLWLDKEPQREAAVRFLATGNTTAGFLCVGARVRFEKRWFDLDDAGEPALIIEANNEYGELADCCALALNAERWSLHMNAVWALGIEDTRFHWDGRLRVFRTPWEWLARDDRGICIFDWRYARHWVSERSFTLIANDRAHAAELHEKLTLPPPDIAFTVSTELPEAA